MNAHEEDSQPLTEKGFERNTISAGILTTLFVLFQLPWFAKLFEKLFKAEGKFASPQGCLTWYGKGLFAAVFFVIAWLLFLFA